MLNLLAFAIVTGLRKPWDELSDSDCDSDSDSGISRDDSQEESTELRQLLASFTSTITCLFRLSMAIRDPAPESQHRSIINVDNDKSGYEQWDIKHVNEKFSKCVDHLAERLGRAISGRRQYLDYRQSHRQKLGKNIETVGREEPKTEYTTNSTQATPIPAVQASIENEWDEDDALSQTSYASSVNSNTAIRVPPLPKQSYTQDHYECPLCFGIIAIHKKLAWKQHVYRDLHPYSCTFENCATADRLYDSRRAWFKHELEAHRGSWQCIKDCDKTFVCRDDFETHVRAQHPDLSSPDILSALQITSRKAASLSTRVECPLCDEKEIMTLRALLRHLGKHQEQLSLFALPSNMEGSEDGVDESESDRDSLSSDDRPVLQLLDTSDAEDETYLIKCICGVLSDDGNTVLCEKCSTWQHIICYYESADDVGDVHLCTDCDPRSVDRKRAAEKQRQRLETVPPHIDPETSRDKDVLIFKNGRVNYPTHFPVHCIRDGKLIIGTVRQAAAKKIGVDPQRIRLFYKGKNLKHDETTALEEGLRGDGSGSEILCTVGEITAEALEPPSSNPVSELPIHGSSPNEDDMNHAPNPDVERQAGKSERKDYYEILGVEKDAEDLELKKAFRRLALLHHPDRNPGDTAAVKSFEEILKAYETLSDWQKRTLYDSGEVLTIAAKADREEAVKNAAQESKKVKATHEEALADENAAAEEFEKAKAVAEAEAARLKPDPSRPKPPVRFKDALGRNFSFSWDLCKSWRGMEALIKKAFLHVDVIGPHVVDGHYDLVGPEGEIILPQVWETMIQPDWEVTMHMWPMPEPTSLPPPLQASSSSGKHQLLSLLKNDNELEREEWERGREAKTKSDENKLEKLEKLVLAQKDEQLKREAAEETAAAETTKALLAEKAASEERTAEEAETRDGGLPAQQKSFDDTNASGEQAERIVNLGPTSAPSGGLFDNDGAGWRDKVPQIPANWHLDNLPLSKSSSSKSGNAAERQQEQVEYEEDLKKHKMYAKSEEDTAEPLEEEMKKRLVQYGFEDDQIESMIKNGRGGHAPPPENATPTKSEPSQEPHQPVYHKVHKKHLSIDTLHYYDIPYEYDSSHADYIVILREMDPKETDILFEHTRRLQRLGTAKLHPDTPAQKDHTAEIDRREAGGNDFLTGRAEVAEERSYIDDSSTERPVVDTSLPDEEHRYQRQSDQEVAETERGWEYFDKEMMRWEKEKREDRRRHEGPSYGQRRPPLSARGSVTSSYTSRGRPTGLEPPATVTQNHKAQPLPPARYHDPPPPPSGQQGRFPTFQQSESGSEEYSSDNEDREMPHRRVLMPPPKIKSKNEKGKERPVLWRAQAVSSQKEMSGEDAKQSSHNGTELSSSRPHVHNDHQSRHPAHDYMRSQLKSADTMPKESTKPSAQSHEDKREQGHQEKGSLTTAQVQGQPMEPKAQSAYNASPSRSRVVVVEDPRSHRRRPYYHEPLKVESQRGGRDSELVIDSPRSRRRQSSYDSPQYENSRDAEYFVELPRRRNPVRYRSVDRTTRVGQSAVANQGGNGEIRLRVDPSAPLSLQFNGDMEGRTLQISPAGNGMADVVIGNSRRKETSYLSERGGTVGKSLNSDSTRHDILEGVSERVSTLGNRKSLVAGSARRELEEASVRRSRSGEPGQRRPLRRRQTEDN
jgi:hypothetical protein